MDGSVNRADRVRPLPAGSALVAILQCIVTSCRLCAARRVHLPTHNVGRTIWFADDSVGRVYRETERDVASVADPATLIVTFRLRWIGSGTLAHRLFRLESLWNTPLFAGFPGFVSKLWIAADEFDRYRGVYEWDGADRAAAYVRALWWPLALVSERGSIRWHVMSGTQRDAALATPPTGSAERSWWHPTPT